MEGEEGGEDREGLILGGTGRSDLISTYLKV